MERAENDQHCAFVIDRQGDAHGDALQNFIDILFRFLDRDFLEGLAHFRYQAAGEDRNVMLHTVNGIMG